MNATSARFITLGPVRRVAAFFALLGFLLLSSCGEKKETHESLMIQQANLYSEMAAILTSLSEGSDPEVGKKALSEQVTAFRDLRAKTAALPRPTEDGSHGLANRDDHQEALTAYLKAERKLSGSEHNSTQIFDILSKLREAVPVDGEGNL